MLPTQPTTADIIHATKLKKSCQIPTELTATGLDDIEILEAAGKISDSSEDAYPVILGVKKKKYYKRVYVTQSNYSSEDDSNYHEEISSCSGSERREKYTGAIRKRHNITNVTKEPNHQEHDSHTDNEPETEEVTYSQLVEYMNRIQKQQKEYIDNTNRMLNILAKTLRTKVD